MLLDQQAREAALHRYITDHAATPFVWGAWDCAQAVAGWVAIATGVDPRGDAPARYTTALGAKRCLGRLVSTPRGRRVPFAGLPVLAAGRLGRPIPPLLARAGDVATVITVDGPALGLVAGASVHHAAEPRGWALTRLSRADRAWRLHPADPD